MKFEQSFSVDFHYPVHFTRSVFAPENDILADVLPDGTSRVLFFADAGLLRHWPALSEQVESWCEAHRGRLELAAPVHPVPGGETVKNDLSILDTVGQLCARVGLDRHSYVAAVGGGAVLDAVGFAASCVHRGVRHMRLPTTTLSQADSGVGVKNGLNRFGIKNFYGTFQPPDAVIADTEFLRTLSGRDLLSGVAEGFKVAITKDAELFEFLENSAGEVAEHRHPVITQIVQRTARLHLEHIQQSEDPFERGSERPLDFGHWAAHRLEEITGYELRHGEAVAIGIGVDACCAACLGLLTERERDRILDAMMECGLPVWHADLARRDAEGGLDVIVGLERFRQHLGGELTLVMPDGIGDMLFVNELTAEVIEQAIEHLNTCASDE